MVVGGRARGQRVRPAPRSPPDSGAERGVTELGVGGNPTGWRCRASALQRRPDGRIMPAKSHIGENHDAFRMEWHHPMSPISAPGSGYRKIGDAIGLALFDRPWVPGGEERHA